MHNARPTLLELDVHDASTSRNLWDRLEGETPKAFAAFCIYRDLGPSDRSLDLVWSYLRESKRHQEGTKRAPGKQAPGYIKRWSSQHRWVIRARAWDAEQDRIVKEQFTRDNLRVRMEVALQASHQRDMAQQLFVTSNGYTNDAGRLDLETQSQIQQRAAKTFETAVKVEFNARGMSSEIVEQRTATVEDPAEFVPKDAAEHYGTMLDIIAGLNLPATHTDPKRDGGRSGEEPTS